jgi:hypothetical protein
VLAAAPRAGLPACPALPAGAAILFDQRCGVNRPLESSAPTYSHHTPPSPCPALPCPSVCSFDYVLDQQAYVAVDAGKQADAEVIQAFKSHPVHSVSGAQLSSGQLSSACRPSRSSQATLAICSVS